MLASGKAPDAIVAEKGLVQVTDRGALESAVDDVLAANPDKAAEYRAGKTKLFGFFVGQVMKATGGAANPTLVKRSPASEARPGIVDLAICRRHRDRHGSGPAHRTDRAPSGGPSLQPDPTKIVWRRLERRGLIRRGEGALPAWFGKRRPPRLRGSIVKDLLAEREAGW